MAPLPKKPNSNVAKLVVFLKGRPEERFSHKRLVEITGLPEATVSNAFRLGYIRRTEDGLYYYPEQEADSTSLAEIPENFGTALDQTPEGSKNALIRQAIQEEIDKIYKEIDRLQKKVEQLKELLKSY